MTDKTNNMAIWDQVCKTDPEYTKKIEGKGFLGTSINPTYVYQKLTNLFGPCGIGWGYSILNEEYRHGHVDSVIKDGHEISNTTILHVVKVGLWYKQPHETLFPKDVPTSEIIEAFGQTYFVRKTGSGDTEKWTTDEEAPKKSLTDALTKAASMIGVSADIYSGKWDGCKYQGGSKTSTTTTAPKTKFPPCPNCGSDTIFEDKKKKGELYCWKAKGGCGERYASLEALEQMAGALKPRTVSNGQTTHAGGLQNQDDIPIGDVPKEEAKVKYITEKQRKLLFAKSNEAGWTNDELKAYLDGSYGIDSTEEIPASKFNEILGYID